MGRGRIQPPVAADDRDGRGHQGPRRCNLEKAGTRRMRKRQLPFAVWILALASLFSPALRAQSIENFRWLDLRQPSDVQTIVARALMNEPYTALREIGYIGLPPKETTTPPNRGVAAAASAASTAAANSAKLQVPRDAHLLVIVAERSNPSALPDDDTLSVYDVNQRQISATLLLRGPGLRLLGWLRMWREGSPELVATYDDCAECQRTTFFTTFHIDMKSHLWEVRWPRSTSGAPIFSEGQEANGGAQVYAASLIIQQRIDLRANLLRRAGSQRRRAGLCAAG